MSDPLSAWPQTVALADVVRRTPAEPFRRRLTADAPARAAIAAALGIEALERLEADLEIRGWFDGAQIDGRWSATIQQICGVTLDPFSSDLAGEFTLRVVPDGSVHAPDPAAEVVIDLDAEDPPDVLEGDLIDLGAYVVEHLALEIDPFPRRPDATFEPPAALAETSPFAALQALKPKDPPANDP